MNSHIYSICLTGNVTFLSRRTHITLAVEQLVIRVFVYQTLLTIGHGETWRGGRAGATTQLTNSRMSSWKAAMVLQHRESPDHTSQTHMKCRKHAVM